MYKVIWRKLAQDELTHVIEYTKNEWSEEQAGRLIEVFAKADSTLSQSPRLGRKIRRPNAYALVLSKVPFVILYEIDDKNVLINQIIHTSKRR